MPGPCSRPEDVEFSWSEMNETVCDLHHKCEMQAWLRHDYITFREWLYRRNRLRTGKTA